MLKRFFSISALALCLTVFLTACSTESSKSYTYSVDNGDIIEISVDTTEQDYDITDEVPISITLDGEEVFQGGFIYSYTFEDYRSVYEAEPTAELVDSGEKDGNEYFAYSLPDEVDYFVNVASSDTAIALASTGDLETAESAFDALTISVAD